MNFTEPVIAAIIGATATVVTALVQLRVAGKKQAAEKASGKPVSKPSKVSWLSILALMVVSALGGYAYSEYRAFEGKRESERVRNEMNARIVELSAAASRLERAGSERDGVNSDALAAASRKFGADGVAAVVNLAPCRAVQSGPSKTPAICTEGNALRTSLCVSIPLAAMVSEVQLFSRAEDSQQAWAEARLQVGHESEGIRFVENFTERTTLDGKEVCQTLLHWQADKSRAARILVKYVP
ncbi:MAG: hypothetical protein ABL878_15885 [Burkholderiales bacterium]